MMGRLQPKQPSLFAYDVNLELRLPSDHPLRTIKRTLDLEFVDAAVEKTYGRSGNQSIPPQTILRMLFLLFYYNIPCVAAGLVDGKLLHICIRGCRGPLRTLRQISLSNNTGARIGTAS